VAHTPADSPVVLEFVEVARDFCAIVAEHASIPAAQFLHRVHLVFPRLYSGALLLPRASADAPDCDSTSTRPALYDSLREQLGDLDFYREIFDPHQLAQEPVVGSLSDDIADIYGELAGALECWDAGNREGALGAWRFGFQSHWGRHLTSALRALHIGSSYFELKNGTTPP
jgi:hypothetical protein